MSFLDGLRPTTSRQQVLLASIVAALVCVVLVGAYFAFWRKPYAVLFANLRPADAATIVAELDKRKTPYRLADGGATILAPAQVVDSTRLAIMSQDLPLKGMVGFELFNKSDMGLTEFAQKVNYQRALQGELARTIMSMDTVDTARVHLSLPDPTIFRDDRRPAKASVTVIPRPGRELPPGAVNGIQRLVAASVADLSAADVVVLDEHGAVISAEPQPVATEATGTALERFYAAKARQAVLQRFPSSSVEVAVAATAGQTAAATPPEGVDTPGDRAVGLNVAVSMAPFPDPAGQQDVRALIADAIGFDAAQGDVILLSPLVGSVPAVAPPAAAIAPAQPPSPVKSGTDAKLVVGVLAVLLIGAFLAVLWPMGRERAQSRRLTPEQRDLLVRRLNTLLKTGDGHASTV